MCLWELACRRQGQWGQLICPAISPSATVIIAPPPDTRPTSVAAPGRVLNTAFAPYPN